MLNQKNEILYLIFFLIIAMLIGFTSAYFFQLSSIVGYLVIATLISLFIFSLILFIYRFYKKHTIHTMYSNYLAHGRYLEVTNRIDSDSKEMEEVWEYKLLALFHSGNISEFMRLYRNYMNEINECATLERYQICLLHDVLLAVESPNKPVRFLKNTETAKYKYKKNIDYQLYTNIYMGLKEYYQPQRNLVKVYFEKFLQQTQQVSQPLSFYLYYLMTLTMFENNHPLCEAYVQTTQSYIYDDYSLQLVDKHIQQGIKSMQKGSGCKTDMDRQRDDTNFLNDIDMKSPFPSSFDMEETGFRTAPQAQEGFVKKRHASDFQSDFDALNATVQNGSAFNLYEENEYEEMAPRRTQRDIQPTMTTSEEANAIDMDLDPTWFARSTLRDDEPIVTANYSMRNPRMQNNNRQQQMQEQSPYPNNPMQQDPFMNTSTYQDIPVAPTYPTNNQLPQQQQEEPSFMETRSHMDNNQQANLRQQGTRAASMQSRNPMMNQNPANRQAMNQQRFPNQMDPRTQNDMNPSQRNQVPQMQNQRMQDPTMMQQNMVNTPTDRFSRFQQPNTPRTPLHEDMQRDEVRNETVGKHKFSRKEKKNKQDPFGFDNPNAIGKDPFLHESANQNTRVAQAPRGEMVQQRPRSKATQSSSYGSFVKRNLTIAGLSLLNAIVVSVASSSFVYTQFFYKYPISSDIITQIVLLSSLVAIAMTYLVTGIHTGWTILKKPLENWSMVAKCLTSPLLLIACLLIGALVELPYLIYASIKANKEKATM